MKYNFTNKKLILQGEYKIPGDKSISHRIIMISSLLHGKTIIKNISLGEDVKHTIEAMKILGINILHNSTIVEVIGKGMTTDFQAGKSLYLGNSGSSARMLAGLLAPYDIITEINGDDSLNKRPMQRIMDPLIDMGVKFIATNDKTMPLTIIGKSYLKDIEYVMKIASAQVKSALLLAAIRRNNITIIEPKKSRNHTELMLQYFGADIKVTDENITLNGGKELYAKGNYIVPSDPSSAAFLAVAAILIPGSKIILKNININPTRIGLYKILQKMGARIFFNNQHKKFNEEIADINIEYSANLKAMNVGIDYVPSMIDEYPILAIAAAHAAGVSRFEGLDELKFKESNRLVAIYEQLQQCGINMSIGDNWLEIHGNSDNINIPSSLKTYGDHRIAMSLIILAASKKQAITLDNVECINTSFPEFFSVFS